MSVIVFRCITGNGRYIMGARIIPMPGFAALDTIHSSISNGCSAFNASFGPHGFSRMRAIFRCLTQRTPGGSRLGFVPPPALQA